MSKLYEVDYTASGIVINPFTSPEKKLHKLVDLYREYFKISDAEEKQNKKSLLANAETLALSKVSKSDPRYSSLFQAAAQKLFVEDYKNMIVCFDIVENHRRFNKEKADKKDLDFVEFVKHSALSEADKRVEMLEKDAVPTYMMFCLALSHHCENQQKSSFEEEQIERE